MSGFGGNTGPQAPAASPFTSAFGNNAGPQAPAGSAFKSVFGNNAGPQAPAGSAFKSAFGNNAGPQAPAASAFKSAFGNNAGPQAPAGKLFQTPPTGAKGGLSALKSGSSTTWTDADSESEGSREMSINSASLASAAAAANTPFGATNNSPTPFGSVKATQPIFGTAKETQKGFSLLPGANTSTGSGTAKNAFGNTIFNSSPATGGFGAAGILGDAPTTGAGGKFGGSAGSVLGDAPTGFPKPGAPQGVFHNPNAGVPKEVNPPVQKEVANPTGPKTATVPATEGDVWRCQECGKIKDLKGPHLNGKSTVRSDCWPCAKKQTFVRGNVKAVVMEDGKTAGQKVTGSVGNQASAAKSGAVSLFKAPAIPPEGDIGVSFLMKTAAPSQPPADAKAVPSAASEAAPATSSSIDDVWRCQECGKTKDLKGPHLNGKSTVRSDCWPCAKKQTFVRGGAVKPITNTSAADHQPVPSPSSRSGEKASDQTGQPASDKGAGSAEAKIASSFNCPHIPMSDTDKSGLLPQKVLSPTPSSTVVPKASVSPVPPTVSPAIGSNVDDVWRCQVCGKTKDLKGPHLNGKSTVRSDCWPCAKKQTFVRGNETATPQTAAPQAPEEHEKPQPELVVKSAAPTAEKPKAPTPSPSLAPSPSQPKQDVTETKVEKSPASPPPPPPPPGCTAEEITEIVSVSQKAITNEMHSAVEGKVAALEHVVVGMQDTVTALMEEHAKQAAVALDAVKKTADATLADLTNPEKDPARIIAPMISEAKEEIISQVRADVKEQLTEFRRQFLEEMRVVLLDHYKRLLDREAAESSEYFPGPMDDLRAKSTGSTTHLKNAFQK